MTEAILFRPQARDDLEAHALWIARESRERALAFLDAVEQTLQQLLVYPEPGTSREWLSPHCRDLRFRLLRSFPHHLIFYRPVESGIEVVRILHSARDIGLLLAGES